MTVSMIAPNTHKFPWITTASKALIFLLKNRIKAPRVVPAPSTGDAATDDTTRREFERVKEQLNADYQDQRALLNDLEPLLSELSEQMQAYMAYRDEQMMNMMMMMMAMRTGVATNNPAPPVPALPAPAGPVAIGALPGSTPASEFLGGQTANAYEGQLIKGDGTDAIYKVENGRKRWIVNQDAFVRAGFKWDAVRVIPRQIVDNIPFGSNIG